ncbi:hypothetical protein AB0M02_13420 [Actinoplanes sp. NPDC051861]|uniref:hypothetical protein n=1 Tax=Actinoplanes sp. NPDC051861 TaxID=3155170 RepID=UPI00342A3B26
MNAEDRDIIDRFRRSFFEATFRSWVEDGSIEVGSRTFDELLTDFRRLLQDFVNEPDFEETEFHPIFDHQEKLLERAVTETNEGDDLIGIMFYATWFEHFINGILIRSLRRAGFAEDIYIPMIRTFNLQTKMASTWKLAGLPEVPAEMIRTLNLVTELRNGFVHYKWSALSPQAEEQQKTRLREATNQVASLVSYFKAVEDQFFWNGREAELIEAFRADLLEAERENPPPYPAIVRS